MRDHETFTRRGDDLHASVAVPMTAAALGVTMSFATLDGEQEITIKRGTQPGDTIVLPGLGVTHLRREGRGDLVIHVDVRTPTKLDAEQERLLRELAAVRDEEQPDGELDDVDSGFVGRLRHAFKR